MKLERMLSIITYLLSHEKVKAQELADKFEVSLRTIYRDIDTIALAGIPITTYQGANGGIGIVPEYKLDKSVLTSDELQNILTGLKGLNSIHEDVKIKFLIEKLSSIARQNDYLETGSEIMIDLSSWNKDDLLPATLKTIKTGIKEAKMITFDYFTNNQLIRRRVEPYKIVFKEANWYLYAYCTVRKDFRLFKIRRMRQLYMEEEQFKRRRIQLDKVQWDGTVQGEERANIVLIFDKTMAYTIYDSFGISDYEVLEDGRLKISIEMGLSTWLYSFLLGFGNKVEVVEPQVLRDRIKDIAKSICQVYK